MILEFIIFLIGMGLFASVIAYALTLRVKIVKLTNLLVQEAADKIAISDTLDKAMKEAAQQNLKQSDGFIKFLSESRDSAFKYIEEVQAELNKFMKDIGPLIDAYRAMPVKNASTQKMITAYDSLIKVMPEANNNS